MTSFSFGDLYKDATTLVTGTFDGIVTESTLTQSANGKPMIKVKLQVEGGQHHGKTFFTQFVISVESPNALRMFFTNMKAFGLDGAFFAQDPSPDHVANVIVGKRCRFTVGKREWQGVERESVDKVEPPLAGAQNLPAPGFGGSIGTAIPSPTAGVPAAPDAPQTPSVLGSGLPDVLGSGAPKTDVPAPPAF